MAQSFAKPEQIFLMLACEWFFNVSEEISMHEKIDEPYRLGEQANFSYRSHSEGFRFSEASVSPFLITLTVIHQAWLCSWSQWNCKRYLNENAWNFGVEKVKCAGIHIGEVNSTWYIYFCLKQTQWMVSLGSSLSPCKSLKVVETISKSCVSISTKGKQCSALGLHKVWMDQVTRFVIVSTPQCKIAGLYGPLYEGSPKHWDHLEGTKTVFVVKLGRWTAKSTLIKDIQKSWIHGLLQRQRLWLFWHTVKVAVCKLMQGGWKVVVELIHWGTSWPVCRVQHNFTGSEQQTLWLDTWVAYSLALIVLKTIQLSWRQASDSNDQAGILIWSDPQELSSSCI